MDSNRLARVSRLLANRRSRRAALASVLAGDLGMSLFAAHGAMARSRTKKPCPPCRRRKKGKCKAALPDGAACATGTCQAGQCVAPPAPPPPPPPASPGCGSGGPCLVLLSSSLHFGDLGGLNSGDAICQNLATAAGLPGTFKAWLSSELGSVSSRFVPNPGPYRLVNGTQIATSFADLTDGALLAPIDLTETGGGMGATPFVWTATSVSGVANPGATCVNWTSRTMNNTGQLGFANRTDGSWTLAGANNCDQAAHLYCFQQR